MGFTDHDQALEFGGVVYRASSGFTGTELEAGLGLSVDNMDVEGALSSEAITEEDIAAGRYDNAEIQLFRVNWQDPAQRVLLRRGNIGEVTRGALAFQAEFRSMAHRLQQTVGRTFQYGCDAVLGDERCGVDLAAPEYKVSGTVTSAAERTFAVSGLELFEADHFSRGLLLWETGGNAGARVKVKAHKAGHDYVELSLWQLPAFPIVAGDTFTVTAGCPHTFDACRDKFANAANYRGFPHIPGNDFVLSYARQDEQDNDGSAIIS